MDTVLKILNEIRPENDFEKSDSFLEDGLLSSMDIIELVSRLEKNYGIEFDIMDMVPENFCSLEAIERVVNKYE